MGVRPSFTVLSRLGLVVALSLAFLPGCGRSPAAPASTGPMLTGFVYEVMTEGEGEPPIPGALITVTEEDGGTSSTQTNSLGYYSVATSTGPVVVTATKQGYRTRQSKFDVTDSTVLNFALRQTD